jgi:hypothetical protein
MMDEIGSETELGAVCTPTPARSIKGLRWVAVVLAVLSSTFFYGLDNTVVADIQPTVVQQYNAIDRLPWVSVTFLIGAASTNFF